VKLRIIAAAGALLLTGCAAGGHSAALAAMSSRAKPKPAITGQCLLAYSSNTDPSNPAEAIQSAKVALTIRQTVTLYGVVVAYLGPKGRTVGWEYLSIPVGGPGGGPGGQVTLGPVSNNVTFIADDSSLRGQQTSSCRLFSITWHPGT
jgi:hypothetical protein